MSRRLFIVGCFGLMVAAEGVAQTLPPEKGGTILSIGQPPRFKWNGGVGLGAYLNDDRQDFLGIVELGVSKDLLSPVAAALAAGFEGYGGVRGDRLDAGLRAFLAIPIFLVGGGADYNARDGDFTGFFSLNVPVARGGVWGTGANLRINWYPWKGHTFTVGFTWPLRQRWAASSRPRDTRVRVAGHRPDPVYYDIDEPAIDAAVADFRGSALWIARLTVPYFDQDGRDREDAMRAFMERVEELEARLAVRTFTEEVYHYHAALARAFSIAAGTTAPPPAAPTLLGEMIADTAKAILLEEVIFPYNRLLGMRRANDTALELGRSAQGRFARWLVASSTLPAERHDALLYVFQELTLTVEEVRRVQLKEWRDRRLIWIPLQLALRPDQHDSQAELDAILEGALDRKFTEGNRVWYLENVKFQWELWRMIREAEDYHVLWIHDYRGYHESGVPDSIAFFQTVEAYLAAMTQRARGYDETGKFPVYMLMLDQHYYEINKAKLWLDVLENPLEAELDLPGGYEWMERAVADAQAELRAAVAGSELLQAEARQYGDEWLSNRIKLHVNITHPADLTFWSSQGLKAIIGGFPDNIMRDHRKLAFYDVSEDDPHKGMAIYTGVGVGEHYTGPGWEDRSILAQGPALLNLKYAARELLLNNGFQVDELPPPLRIRPKAPGYESAVRAAAADPFSSRAMELHNEVGYHEKPINVLKATIYSLMPPGSVMKIPDSLWNSPFLAGLLVGSCLRGARVYVIGPALENAPSSGTPQMSRAQELFTRLVILRQRLGPEIATAGGELRVGLYNLSVDARDTRGRVQAWLDGVRAEDFVRELFGFDPEVYDAIQALIDTLPPVPIVADTVLRPKLHQKVNYFASAETWSKYLTRPEIKDLLVPLMAHEAEYYRDPDSYSDPRVFPAHIDSIARSIYEKVEAERTPEEREREIRYLTVGSANQDYRSMLMDGEVAFVVAGSGALKGLLDMLFLTGTAVWVDDLEALDRLLPPYNEFERRLGRALKQAL